MHTTLQEVVPAYEASHPGAIQWLYCNVIQPWHPQSAVMHEACMAVAAVKPEAVWKFCSAVYDQQENFFDDKVRSKSANTLHDELCTIAAEATGIPKSDLGAQLALKSGGGNAGCQITQLVKWYTKMHRVRGVHVTPTVFVNGTEAPQVGSGWSAAEWKDFLDPMLGPAS
ncbi:unnamed protein product [Prorocentrum cordatum]|nr:unnamed protein product [Polarella glacialis]